MESTQKPSVLVCVLCGPERHQWINPRLSTALVQMSHDSRFRVMLDWIFDAHPVDYARNLCVDKARSFKSNWLLMLDNDNLPTGNPLDMIATAPAGAEIIGSNYGFVVEPERRSASSSSYALINNGGTEANGDFLEVPFGGFVGGGQLAIRSSVWEKLKAPWFKWVNGDDELLSPKNGHGEDVYFCRYAQAHGITVWTHKRLIGHMKNVDVTALAMNQSSPHH